ncbi:MAG: VOC family protein, partial [Stackebrandtia sp.]
SGEDMVGGLHRADGDPAGRRVNVVFDADDRAEVTLEDMLETVKANGGEVVTERTAIGEGMGWFASVADPSGLRFELSTDRPKALSGNHESRDDVVVVG